MQPLESSWHAGHYILAAGVLLIDLAASLPVILYKRDTRAAVLWVSFIWLSPGVGAFLYYVLGVNRIRRRAASLRASFTPGRTQPVGEPSVADTTHTPPAQVEPAIRNLAAAVSHIAPHPLVAGNQVDVLVDGDAAFPRMLDAISAARRSIALATYIFDNDPTGVEFVAALAAATRRGVKVRVLIDGAGVRYSFPPVTQLLAKQGVPTSLFMPGVLPARIAALNLRSHRKLLVVDGSVGFTGGMNIRHGHRIQVRPAHPVRDLHFEVRGPVVAHLMATFRDDWMFCTNEALDTADWFPPLAPAGPTAARGIPDGPDEDFERLRWTLLAAIGAARTSVRIGTPYFLPDTALISALNLAAMRGVEVDILLPAHSNLPFVDWASAAHWWQILQWGCRIWLSPPPFDHSKVIVVDGLWSSVGSANLDPRSLRLNFEFNLECYGPHPAAELERLFLAKRDASQPVVREAHDARPLHVRVRDGVARLFTPFL